MTINVKSKRAMFHVKHNRKGRIGDKVSFHKFKAGDKVSYKGDSHFIAEFGTRFIVTRVEGRTAYIKSIKRPNWGEVRSVPMSALRKSVDETV